MTPASPVSICTCADGMLAGYFVVGVFLVLVLVPALFGRLVERRRARALAEAVAGP